MDRHVCGAQGIEPVTYMASGGSYGVDLVPSTTQNDLIFDTPALYLQARYLVWQSIRRCISIITFIFPEFSPSPFPALPGNLSFRTSQSTQPAPHVTASEPETLGATFPLDTPKLHRLGRECTTPKLGRSAGVTPDDMRLCCHLKGAGDSGGGASSRERWKGG